MPPLFEQGLAIQGRIEDLFDTSAGYVAVKESAGARSFQATGRNALLEAQDGLHRTQPIEGAIIQQGLRTTC